MPELDKKAASVFAGKVTFFYGKKLVVTKSS